MFFFNIKKYCQINLCMIEYRWLIGDRGDCNGIAGGTKTINRKI